MTRPTLQDGKETPVAESSARCHWLYSVGGGKDDRRIGIRRRDIGNKLLIFSLILPFVTGTRE